MNLQSLLDSRVVQRARARIRSLADATLDEQVTLAQIAAPPFEEEERAHHVAARLEALGLDNVRLDEVGNVIASLPHRAAGDADLEPVVLSAHLDTVFPRETPLRVRHEQKRIFLPGIADNARGLAALLALVQVFQELEICLRRPLEVVATVGEEGAGDLRGVKHLFRTGSRYRAAAAFISLDGSGLRRIVHRAVGSKRLRARISGTGGHSWSDWGLPNPLHALGRGIAAASTTTLPRSPRTTLTIARAGGGTSVNAIPEHAWLELDARSEGGDTLEAMEAEIRKRIAEAVREENRRRRRGTAPLQLGWEVIGDRPGGATPEKSSLVRAAVAATRALGVRPELASSSTDANVPMSLGIPAVTVGAGGESGGIHTTEEWYSNEGGAAGIERAFLLVAAAAGLG